MHRDALISNCGAYRYWLTRVWDESLPAVSFVMLNPSRADAEIDDPTIRRCIGFARAGGFGRLRVVNLFALRTAHPSELKAAASPVGPDNDAYLDETFSAGDPIVAAWGAHGAFGDRARQFLASARRRGTTLFNLGQTAHGHPRHPLYVRGETPLAPFEIKGQSPRIAIPTIDSPYRVR